MMAEASETLTHPLFGELRWLLDSSHWEAQFTQPGGGRIDVTVAPEDEDRHAFLVRAAELLRWALDNERRILREALRAQLLKLYNDGWRQEDEPELSAEALANRLGWSMLAITASDLPIELTYNPGDLFGGHTVVVEVDAQLRFRDAYLWG